MASRLQTFIVLVLSFQSLSITRILLLPRCHRRCLLTSSTVLHLVQRIKVFELLPGMPKRMYCNRVGFLVKINSATKSPSLKCHLGKGGWYSSDSDHSIEAKPGQPCLSSGIQ